LIIDQPQGIYQQIKILAFRGGIYRFLIVEWPSYGLAY